VCCGDGTCDQNLSYQQTMVVRTFALVVLSTNNWNVLKLNSEPVLRVVEAATMGSFQFVSF
jgi:hypothetical protein